MPIELKIHIPKDEFEHYQHLLKLNTCDYHVDPWVVLNKYGLNIDRYHKVQYAVYNTPLGLAFEYMLINRSSHDEVESSEIFIEISSTWLFSYRGVKYSVSVESTNN